MKKLFNEFIGTFFLVLVVGLAVAKGGNFAALSIGATLMVMVYAGGHISGAHYNPAVTLGVWARGRISGKDMLRYWISQLIGAVLGALTSYLILGSTTLVAPGSDVNSLTAVVCEFLFTFALVWVVLNVATSKATQGNSYYGVAIGFTVMIGAYVVGGISGGAFNPAVALGHQIVDATMILKNIATTYGTSDGAALTYSWIYIVADLLGGLVAGIAYNLIGNDDAL